MRLTAASLTTVAPNDSFFDVRHGAHGACRARVREPGIPASDPIPPDPTSGTPDPNIPIWDENPERLKLDTNGRAGSTGDALHLERHLHERRRAARLRLRRVPPHPRGGAHAPPPT